MTRTCKPEAQALPVSTHSKQHGHAMAPMQPPDHPVEHSLDDVTRDTLLMMRHVLMAL